MENIPQFATTRNLISIIIPLYNKSAYIAHALDSVLTQTYQDYEIIVINDGSTDGSENIVKSYLKENPEKITLINQENQGVSVARNTGIKHAQGELIAFLDADDEWQPEYLETIISLREKYPAAGIYATAYYQMDETSGKKNLIQHKITNKPSLTLFSSYFRAISLGPHPIMTSGIVIPKQILDKFGGFESGMPLGEDLLLWAKIALYYPVAYCEEPLATCWINTNNNHKITAKKKTSDKIPFQEYLSAQNSEDEPFFESDDNIQLYLSYLRVIQAQEYAFSGDRKKALKALITAKHPKILPKKIGCLLYIILPMRVFRILLKITGKFTKIGQTL